MVTYLFGFPTPWSPGLPTSTRCLLSPWTFHLLFLTGCSTRQVLSDPDTTVRKNAVMVITHLILNDMMKIKGHVASMAVCLEVKQLSRLMPGLPAGCLSHCPSAG